jgi:hypothetical protein
MATAIRHGVSLSDIQIGEPQTRKLNKVYPSKEMPTALLNESKYEYHQMDLVVSFPTGLDGIWVDQAELSVIFPPDKDGKQPIAIDMHPREVVHEVKRNAKLGLSPSLNMNGIQGGISGIEFGQDYSEQQPIITASGAQTSQPSWSLKSFRGVRIIGSKWMHLVLRVPKNQRQVFTTIVLTANVNWWLVPHLWYRTRPESVFLTVVLGLMQSSDGKQRRIKGSKKGGM